MSHPELQASKAYDQVESLFEQGIDPDSLTDGELAATLKVRTLLEQCAATTPMPRSQAFRGELLTRVRAQPKFRWWHAGLAMAATVLISFAALKFKRQRLPETLIFDQQFLQTAMQHETRNAMVEYLENTERLLLSMRDYEVACSEDQADIFPEKELAKSLLIQYKLFLPQMNSPNYYQARALFTQLENILVDVNNLDPCVEPLEVDFINRHVVEKRILSKLRLIAQDIQHS